MNGLKFIRTRCNISLSELANVLQISRQQISAWENGKKGIPKRRLEQLSLYFGVDESLLKEISEDQKAALLEKELYLRDDSPKEIYSFNKVGNIEEDIKYRPFRYEDFECSIDEKYKEAKKRKVSTISEIEEVMGYFGMPKILIDEVGSINRACDLYDYVYKYMREMPNQKIEMRMLYYKMLKNTLLALLKSQELISDKELEKIFEHDLGNSLHDDREWVISTAHLFEDYLSGKDHLVKEEHEKLKSRLVALRR